MACTRFGVEAMFFRASLAFVIASLLAIFVISVTKPVAVGCAASDPCGAKTRYEAAVAQEKIAAGRVLKNTPAGRTPAGSRADWLAMQKKMEDTGQLLTRMQLDELVKYAEERKASSLREAEYYESEAAKMSSEIRILNVRISELEGSTLTQEGKALLLKLKNERSSLEIAHRNRLDLAASARGRARQHDDELKLLKSRYQAADLYASLEAWIRYSYYHDEWEKADNELEAAQKEYDAAKADKDRSIARAQKAYQDALDQLARANREMQGKPHDQAYNDRIRGLIAGLTQKLAYAEQYLNGLDCFPDAKALLAKMRQQRAALGNVKLGTPVKQPAKQPVKQPVRPAQPAGAGVFKLTKKEVGHVPGPDAGPYGTWSGSIGESTFSATYQTTSSYEFNANLTANWTVPPDTLKPGDTVELGVVTSGSVTGKDRGAVGLSAGWEVSGSVEVISNTRAFSGISESGKEYGGGSGAVKFKVGTGGTITIASNRGGISWGSGGNFTPCVYTYTFQR